MWNRLLTKAVIAAAGLCLAACATTTPTTENELRELAELGEIGGSSAGLVRRDGGLAIRSGTILPGENKVSANAPRQQCGVYAAQFASISITLIDGAVACSKEDRLWGSDIAKVLSKLLVSVFGVDAPVLSIRFAVAPDRTALDIWTEDSVVSDPIDLLFGINARNFAPLAKRATTSTIAHEVHHAATQALFARRNIIPESPRANADRIFDEGAAEMFGICASLMVDNIASRAERNHTLNDRPGGVLTDAEISNFLKTEGDPNETRVPGVTASVLGQMVANSLWTSTIGPDYFAAGDSEEGQKLLALCANGSLSSIESFRQLLTPFANDGVDAPAFPAWSDEIGESYFRRYDDAHARWREKHGLPPK